MASDGHFPGFVPGRGYTQEDWDEVSDNPEITPEQAAASRPLAETMPEFVAAIKRGRGNPRAPTKDLVTLRLDKDVLSAFRASGSGWQSRANEMLRKGLGLDTEGARRIQPETIREGMEVVGSDGLRLGVIERSEKSGLLKLRDGADVSATHHHYVSREMVASVAGQVMLAVTAEEAKRRWIAA